MFTFNSKVCQWIAAALVALSIIVCVDFAYKWTDGTRNIAPGWTPSEFNWRFSRPAPAARVFVVGASNVNWGIAETSGSVLLSENCGIPVDLANVGISGHNALAILESMKGAGLAPAVILYSYDPISSGIFTWEPPVIRKNVLRQEMQDAAISVKIAEILPTFGLTSGQLRAHFFGNSSRAEVGQLYWSSRTAHSEGMITGERAIYGKRSVPSYDQLLSDQIGRMRIRMADFFESQQKPEKMKARISSVIKGLEDAGHRVFLTQIPSSIAFQAAFQEILPPDFSPSEIASENMLSFIDLEPVDLTYDGNHLSYSGALRVTTSLVTKLNKKGVCELLKGMNEK